MQTKTLESVTAIFNNYRRLLVEEAWETTLPFALVVYTAFEEVVLPEHLMHTDGPVILLLDTVAADAPLFDDEGVHVGLRFNQVIQFRCHVPWGAIAAFLPVPSIQAAAIQFPIFSTSAQHPSTRSNDHRKLKLVD